MVFKFFACFPTSIFLLYPFFFGRGIPKWRKQPSATFDEAAFQGSPTPRENTDPSRAPCGRGKLPGAGRTPGEPQAVRAPRTGSAPSNTRPLSSGSRAPGAGVGPTEGLGEGALPGRRLESPGRPRRSPGAPALFRAGGEGRELRGPRRPEARGCARPREGGGRGAPAALLTCPSAPRAGSPAARAGPARRWPSPGSGLRSPRHPRARRPAAATGSRAARRRGRGPGRARAPGRTGRAGAARPPGCCCP